LHHSLKRFASQGEILWEKNKIYEGKIYAVSSRINAETRSLLTRIMIKNESSELIPGSLLEIIINYNERSSLGVPDTSMMIEGSKSYVYKVSEDNIANKTEIEIGIRNSGFIEIISGLDEGEVVVAEGLKKLDLEAKLNLLKNNVYNRSQYTETGCCMGNVSYINCIWNFCFF